MTAGFPPGSDSFEDLLARFFGAQGSRQVHRVDLTRLTGEPTRDLIVRAARQAAA